jgi:type II secretory pathway predicted ATPase ExeA
MDKETIAARMKDYAGLIIAHDLYKSAIEQILHSIEITNMTEHPSCALLTGEPGTGKTTLARHIVARMPESEIKIDSSGVKKVVPAFFCSVPSSISVKSMAQHMLFELSGHESRGDAGTLTRKLVQLLKTCETKAILLDEFHDLLARGADKTRDGVCDWVKGILNESGVPITLIGTPECAVLIDQHKQLARRYPIRVSLSRMEFSTSATSQYIRILKGLSKGLTERAKIPKIPALTDGHAASAIYVATGGNMNSLRLLLKDVVFRSLTRGGEHIEMDDFEAACNESRLEHALSDRAHNPFKMTQSGLNAILSKN